MGKFYVFHDWKNLKNSWDNKEKINNWFKRHIWDNIVAIISIFIFIYLSLVFFFQVPLKLPPYYCSDKKEFCSGDNFTKDKQKDINKTKGLKAIDVRRK